MLNQDSMKLMIHARQNEDFDFWRGYACSPDVDEMLARSREAAEDSVKWRMIECIVCDSIWVVEN